MTTGTGTGLERCFVSVAFIAIAIVLGFLPRSLTYARPWQQFPGLTLQDTLDRLQSDVEALKRNFSSAAHINERYTNQLNAMDTESAQLRQGLISFLQRFVAYEQTTIDVSQGMGLLQTRLQSVQSEFKALQTKADTRLVQIERANSVWRRNFKTVNKALKVLKRKIKFRMPV